MKIAVIGVGSAGITAIGHLLATLPNDHRVVSIHDPSKPILGIGESTNPSFIDVLQYSLDFAFHKDMPALDATFKFGTRFVDWRDHEFINPLLSGTCSVHFNTHNLRDFALPRFAAKWGKKFDEIRGCATSIEDKGNFVSVMVDGSEYRFDYVIDCGGFPTDYTDYNMSNVTMLNRCIVHNALAQPEKMYTEHFATPNGWMFGVPLTSRMTYGYLFDDRMTSVEDARADMAQRINVPLAELGSTEYRFKPYSAKQVVKGRICKSGNRAVFFEPISTTSIFLYHNINRLVTEYMLGVRDEEATNEVKDVLVAQVEGLIAYLYHGGSNFDTPFWRKNVLQAKQNLEANTHYQAVARMWREADPNMPYPATQGLTYAPYNLMVVDKNMGFGIFEGGYREKA